MIFVDAFKRYRTYLVPSTAIKLAMNIGKFKSGFCPVCGKKTIFLYYGLSLREDLFCVNCLSNSRKRHVAKVLSKILNVQSIAETSPDQPISIYNTDIGDCFDKFLSKNKLYNKSSFFPELKSGTMISERASCQNIECMSYEDEKFDIVITEDVLEHVRHYEDALHEIKRVLKPGGVHVFTVPINLEKSTLTKVKVIGDRDIFLEPPEYHGGPRRKNILVYRIYGSDLIQTIEDLGFIVEIEVCNERDARDGIFMSTVFIARKL